MPFCGPDLACWLPFEWLWPIGSYGRIVFCILTWICVYVLVLLSFEVFCGRIPKDIFEDELIPHFEKCGKIWDLRLMMDPLTSNNRGFCFVTFTERDGAQEAVKRVRSTCGIGRLYHTLLRWVCILWINFYPSIFSLLRCFLIFISSCFSFW